MGNGSLFIEPFISYIRFEKRYSPHTVVSYSRDLNQFFDYLSVTYGGEIQVNEISYHFIRSWLASLKQGGMRSKSITRKISSLKSFYRYLLRQKAVILNPMTRIVTPKIEKRLPGFVNQSEMEQLQDQMETQGGNKEQGLFAEGFEGDTHKLILLILYFTGIRLSELINLKTTQVDHGNLTIKVLGKGSKERIIPVSERLIRQITEYQLKKATLGKGTDFQILLVRSSGEKLYPKYVYRVVRAALGQVTTQGRLSPHLLRHTFATHLTNNGAELDAVKELLGHSSLASTQVYTHNTIGKLKEIHQQAHPKS